MRKIRKGCRWDGRRFAKLEVCWENPDRPGVWVRRRRKVHAETLAEAERLYREFREEILHPPAPKAKAVDDTFESYVRSCWPISKDAASPISEDTAREEWYLLDPKESKNGIFALIGHHRLAAIDENVIEDFRAVLRRANLSPYTVNRAVRLVHKCLTHAERRAKVIVPALRNWPSKLREEEIHQEMSDEEIERFLLAFETGRIPGGAGGEIASDYLTALFRAAQPLFICALFLGLARKDLLNLRWKDVDFERGLVLLARAKTKQTAVIPLSDRARMALLACRSREVVSKDFCFVTPVGERYSETTFRRYFKAALRIAKIERQIRPHDMRHSFGSLLVRRGVPLAMIAKSLGHANIRTTQRYSRVDIAAMQRVAEALNSL